MSVQDPLPTCPCPFRRKSPLSARSSRSPLRAAAGESGRLLLSLVPALVPALVWALASLATASQSRAEEFDLARLTENIDLALEATNNPAGELVANFAFGQFDMNFHHSEFLGGMAQPDRKSTRLNSSQ